MKVLFVSGTHCDWIASTLYQGLCEVLGPESIHDATGGDRDLPGCPCHAAGTFDGPDGPELGFDLMVLNACFLANHDWCWAVGHLGVETRGLPGGRLSPNCKIVYVEGYDGANDVNPPPFPVDAVFRREIDPDIRYPYRCQSIDFALPERCFDLGDHHRPSDFACVMRVHHQPLRRRVMDEALKLARFRTAYVGEDWGHDAYLDAFRKSKLAICVRGGADCGDCMRNAEVVAMGAIPVFVEPPRRVKVPYYAEDEVFLCHSVSNLGLVIKEALDEDLAEMRKRVQTKALRDRTTAAMARRLLRSVGMVP